MKAWQLVKKGWCQGHWSIDSKGNPAIGKPAVKFCAVEALLTVYHGNTEYIAARKRLEGVLGTSKLIYWNDDPDRTQEEVVSAMERADV
jgi:hypothetical protein